LGVGANLHHGSTAGASEDGSTSAGGTGDSAVLERSLKQLAVDESVEVIVVHRSGLWLWALLYSVERGALARHVHDGLRVGHLLTIVGTVGAVGGVVVGLVDLSKGNNRARH